jgi:murein L,D-transpeptidase YafK
MKIVFSLFLTTILYASCMSEPKSDDRVALAYRHCEAELRSQVEAANCTWGAAVAMVVYKHEMRMDVYLEQDNGQWIRFKSMPICAASGRPGRKLREGDRQVPEGFYRVSVFNPKSNFHLSLGINYPNDADRHVADPNHPGGDIYVHGGCASIGCCAMTDEGIEPLYVLCDAAKRAEKPAAKVMILPCHFDETDLQWRSDEFAQWQKFWSGLREGWSWFIQHKSWPIMEVDSTGNYMLISEPI